MYVAVNVPENTVAVCVLDMDRIVAVCVPDMLTTVADCVPPTVCTLVVVLLTVIVQLFVLRTAETSTSAFTVGPRVGYEIVCVAPAPTNVTVCVAPVPKNVIVCVPVDMIAVAVTSGNETRYHWVWSLAMFTIRLAPVLFIAGSGIM
jgi:hypothetical protein